MYFNEDTNISSLT